jgi:hypothetical protein
MREQQLTKEIYDKEAEATDSAQTIEDKADPGRRRLLQVRVF